MRQGTPRHATALRLGGGFAVVLALFGAALVVTLETHARIADAESEVEALDEARLAGHRAAAQVREQYIHQAHTIINWDQSHIGHYDAAVRNIRRATKHLQELMKTSQEKSHANHIARLARQSDEEFRRFVLAAIRRDDRTGVRQLHDRAEALVNRVVVLSDELNRMLRARSAAARTRAATLRRQARLTTLVCFGLATALAIVVGWLITRSILRPISALREGARRVGQGDLGARIEVLGRDELSELAQAFNEMTADLERHQEDLLRSQKLASIGRVAAGVAHEINNPLLVILGYAKLMPRNGGLVENDEIRIIEEEAMQCQRIVGGLLDLARPQHLDLGPVDVAELSRDVIRRLQETAAVEGRQIRPPPPGVQVFGLGDEDRLRQVISGLVTNAANATDTDGTITLEAHSDGAEVLVMVTDDGTGIPDDVLPNIFEPFVTTGKQGVGLGLAIAQAIVDAHGGRIEINSALGKGTRAVLHLRAAPRDPTSRSSAEELEQGRVS